MITETAGERWLPFACFAIAAARRANSFMLNIQRRSSRSRSAPLPPTPQTSTPATRQVHSKNLIKRRQEDLHAYEYIIALVRKFQKGSLSRHFTKKLTYCRFSVAPSAPGSRWPSDGGVHRSQVAAVLARLPRRRRSVAECHWSLRQRRPRSAS